MARVHLHFPVTVRVTGRPSDAQLDALAAAVARALARRIAQAHGVLDRAAPARGTAEPVPEPVREPVDPARRAAGGYRIPSYDDGGAVTAPLQEPAAAPAGAPSTAEQAIAHVRATFGALGPVGQTHYAVQLADGRTFVVVRGSGTGTAYEVLQIAPVRRDSAGHWTVSGGHSPFARGRYEYRVTGPADTANPPAPHVAVVTGLGGGVVWPRVYTRNPVGTRIVIDVPASPAAGASPGGGAGGGTGGGGPVPGGTALVRVRCAPAWDTSPLTDPAYAGMDDDDLGRLFLNLCNARAEDNLARVERTVREELVPRFAGSAGGAALSEFSRHNLQHFQEDLRLLRGLMLALARATRDAEVHGRELDALTLVSHPTGPFHAPLGFGAGLHAQAFWPTVHPPAPRDAARAEALAGALAEDWARIRTLRAAVLRLLEEEPLLTRFVEGLSMEGSFVTVSRDARISSELADLGDVAEVQRRLLEELNGILDSVGRAREMLCRDPERVLDVPLVYEEVRRAVAGIHARFDAVAGARIAAHQRREAWTDAGLGAAGLALFVGGLFVSLAGGPAGVVLFLGAAGTAVGAVSTARSVDRAGLFTSLANASIHRGGGLVALAAAEDAAFWATVDVALLGLDVALGGLQAFRTARQAVLARRAGAAGRLAEAADELARAERALQQLDFDELLARAASRGSLPVSEAELLRLQGLARSGQVAERRLLGELAEALVERTAVATGEYLPLATKLNGNQGIDVLLVRRHLFEQVFGAVADPRDARRLLAAANDGQLRRLRALLLHGGGPDTLVSVEVKFSRAGAPAVELLSAARGGVQQNRAWYQGLMSAMRNSADAEVRASAQLLEELLGADAAGVGRLARVGITVDPNAGFALSRLTDEIIDLASQSRRLYRSRRYYGLQTSLLAAEHAGNATAAERVRELLRDMNQQIDSLDAAVAAAQRAEAARQQALRGARAAAAALVRVEGALPAAQTASGAMALRGANAAAHAHLQDTRERGAQVEADLAAARAAVAAAERERTPLTRRLDLLESAYPAFFGEEPAP